MMSKILQSVVSITSQKDTNDLSYSMIATLAELVNLSSAAMIHCCHGEQPTPLVHLEIKRTDLLPTYHWDNHSYQLSINLEKMTECLIKQSPVVDKLEHKYVHYFPIVISNTFSTALILTSSEELSDHYSVINGLLLIYKNYHSLLEESEHDKLTGLLNRNSFERRLQRLARSNKPPTATQNNNGSAWLAIIDIDFFKRINDTYGHVGGDEILLIISQLMKTYFGPDSLLFRFGGEEFIVIVDKLKKAQAESTLESFRQLVSEHSFPFSERLTVSIGYCELESFDYPTTIIDQADKALYHAKETGRNKTLNYHELIVQGLLVSETSDGDIELF